MFPNTVRSLQACGIVGDLIFDSPQRAETGVLNSVSAAYNVIGRAFCRKTASDLNEVEAGGTGDFAGILFNSKSYSTLGTTAGALQPTLTLPNETQVELLRMGIVLLSLDAAAEVGDTVVFDTTTGVLSPLAVEAAFTAAQATTVLTVSAITAGKIGVGSVIKNAAGEILGEVISLGTGTGGTGTYNLNTSATVGSAAMTANSVAPAGKRVVPNSRVDRLDLSDAGLAIVSLTN